VGPRSAKNLNTPKSDAGEGGSRFSGKYILRSNCNISTGPFSSDRQISNLSAKSHIFRLKDLNLYAESQIKFQITPPNHIIFAQIYNQIKSNHKKFNHIQNLESLKVLLYENGPSNCSCKAATSPVCHNQILCSQIKSPHVIQS